MNQYKLGCKLGAGTFGVVRVAEHLESGRRFAAKFVSETMDPESLQREIDHQALLDHRHIVGIHEVVRSPNTVIVMELVTGSDLFDHIVQQLRLPEAEARRIFQQLVAALRHCHERGVCHRDLKPENILLDEQHNVKLADFGLSGRMTEGEPMRDSVGSPNYAAPEVIKKDCAYDGRGYDVWSAGVVLYVMLVGSLPFEDDNFSRLFKKIAAGRYRVPGFLSGSATGLIARALTVDPPERITIKEIYEHEWFRVDLPQEPSETPAHEAGALEAHGPCPGQEAGVATEVDGAPVHVTASEVQPATGGRTGSMRFPRELGRKITAQSTMAIKCLKSLTLLPL